MNYIHDAVERISLSCRSQAKFGTGIRAADRQFLDEILLNENDGHLLGRSLLAAADANTDKTAMIASSNEPVPRAELVVNTGIVKRAELVVRGGKVKRAELLRPGRQ